MRRAIINSDHLRFGLLLILMHNCFDIFAVTDSFFGIKYADILLVYCIYFILIYYMRYPTDYFAGRFAVVVLLVPILIILSSLMAKLFYNQDFMAGILTQRAWLVTMFLYFPLRALVKNKILTLDVFWKVLYLIVGLEVSVYILQYILGPNNYFLSVNYTYRYETMRIVANTAYMELVLIHAVSQIIKRVNLSINIFYVVWILLYIFMVNKGRGQVVICIVLIAGIVLLNKTNKFYKTIIISLGFVISANFLINSTAFQDFISIVIEGNEDVTFNVRERSQEFYLNTLNDNPLAWIYGYGMQNTTLISSQEATGMSQGYLITDNGIYGFIFSYGLFGLAWYFYSLSIQLREGWRIYRIKKDSIVIVKIFKDIIFFQTYVWFFYTFHSFYSVLFFILVELLIRDIKCYKEKSNDAK